MLLLNRLPCNVGGFYLTSITADVY